MKEPVSTHSRPKAAVSFQIWQKRLRKFQHTAARRRLHFFCCSTLKLIAFQHTAARRRLAKGFGNKHDTAVSTHSRPKAAVSPVATMLFIFVFQHTAARRRLLPKHDQSHSLGSFNTQPPEGGCLPFNPYKTQTTVSTHSRPKAAAKTSTAKTQHTTFQHTAARRRLNIKPPRP